ETGLANAEKSWSSLKTLYDKINVLSLDEKTGKTIVEEMKQLFQEFDIEFKSYAQNARNTGNFSFPNRLSELKQKINDLGTRYTDEVPAYKAYRWVGRFELDPQGRRGYQIQEEEKE